MRCFIFIELPEKIKEEIMKIQKQLPSFKGKIIEEKNLHLTLKFLGELEENKITHVRELLRTISFNSFTSEMTSLGFFSEDIIRIIWLGLTNCESLQKEIDNRLQDLFPKEKSFIGHLTIARVKHINDKQLFLKKLREISFNVLNFNVDKFYLKKSTLTSRGPVYEDIEIFNLKI